MLRASCSRGLGRLLAGATLAPTPQDAPAVRKGSTTMTVLPVVAHARTMGRATRILGHTRPQIMVVAVVGTTMTTAMRPVLLVSH